MPIDTAGTIAGLDALAHRVNSAVERIVSKGAHLFQAQAMINAPVGDPENSTNDPGDLQRSIDVEGPEGGGGAYVARVGPTVTTANPGRGGEIFNYGRQREFGGEIFPKVSTYLVFRSFGLWAKKTSVFQVGSFYLTRARDEAQPDVERVIEAELTVAIEGG